MSTDATIEDYIEIFEQFYQDGMPVLAELQGDAEEMIAYFKENAYPDEEYFYDEKELHEGLLNWFEANYGQLVATNE